MATAVVPRWFKALELALTGLLVILITIVIIAALTEREENGTDTAETDREADTPGIPPDDSRPPGPDSNGSVPGGNQQVPDSSGDRVRPDHD